MNTDIPDFDSIASKMPRFLGQLKTVEREEIKEKLDNLKGVYIFFENDTPVYVGKTDRLKDRLTEHCNPGSKNNDANFAFKLAKLEWIENKNLDKQNTRKFLQEIPEFNERFSLAKSRVGQMKMKYVEIEDPYEQYLFEFYASLQFKSRYNDFKNH